MILNRTRVEMIQNIDVSNIGWCNEAVIFHVINGKGSFTHRISEEDDEYDEYDYIIGMDSWNIRNINRIIGNSDPEGKVSKLLDFTEEKGKDIADPWYTGDFDTTYRDVKKGCEALLNDCLLRF